MQKHLFYLAPLRGITDRIFRNVYEKHFGQFDYMLAPFIPTIRGNRVKDYHIKDILPESGSARLIPQIIGGDSGGFLLLCRKFADLGFASVNWNLGCPAPLITKKARGCGLLPHRDIIERFLDEVTPKLPIPMSIKARLGLDTNDELEALIPIFNNYPLKELIIHPRTGSQNYDGTVDLDRFEACLSKSANTVVYNGDICSPDDFRYLARRFPNVNKWMIGRGIVKKPRLLNELKSVAGNSRSLTISKQAEIQAVRDFLDDLLNANLNTVVASTSRPPSPAKVLGKMKEIWRYLGASIDASGALTENILHCESVDEYRTIVDAGIPLE